MTDFSIPRRQHPLGIAIISVQFLVNGVRAAWPLLIGITFGGIEGYMLLGIPILLGLILAGAVAYYWRFKYRLEDEALVVERGLLQRERLLIPFDRIQAIQLFQGPLQQLFGLTGLRVDTAGSTGNELQLVAIGKAEAESLRHMLDKDLSLYDTSPSTISFRQLCMPKDGSVTDSIRSLADLCDSAKANGHVPMTDCLDSTDNDGVCL